jgi:hypothetical protein
LAVNGSEFARTWGEILEKQHFPVSVMRPETCPALVLFLSASQFARPNLGLLAADTDCMTTIRKRRLSPHPRRALELLDLLAISPSGATEALLVRAHGFNSDMITDLVSAGLATTERETMKAGARPAEVVRIRITEAGEDALKGASLSRLDCP